MRMMTQSIRFGILAALFCVSLTSQAQAAPASSFYVPVNRSELITTNADIGEVIVADPDVANVVVHGKRKVSVLGVNVGQTSLRIMDGNQKVIRTTDVYVTYDLPAIRRALKEFLPTERIGVSMVNTRIALTGDVSSAQAAAQAVEIAEEFIRGKLSGASVDSRKRVVPGVSQATEDSPVINLMKITAGQQVMLRIKVGEVNRTALRNLGMNLQAIGRDGINIIGATGISEGLTNLVGNPTLVRPSTGFGSFAGNVRTNNLDFGAQLDAMEENGMLKILAEPSLTSLSGEEAQFLAGGEFPIPVPQQLGGGTTSTLTVEYKPYGVALKFVPYVLSKNRIRIQVQPEVSDISPENSINTGGFVIPSFVTRRASTTVELAPGESFMIAGLLRDDVTSKITQLPGAGEIPVLGALFRSTAYQRRETELVIAVTPYIVDPVRDSDIKMPTDDFRPASFMESVFFGAIASGRSGKEPSLEGPAGFMTDN